MLVSGLAKLSIIGFGGNCGFCGFGGNCGFIKLVPEGSACGGGGQSLLCGVGGSVFGKTGWNNPASFFLDLTVPLNIWAISFCLSDNLLT